MEEKSLLEEVRLDFSKHYYQLAEENTRKLTKFEYEAWWNNPATKAIRNLLMGDMKELSLAWFDGVSFDEEDPTKAMINASRSIILMQAKHDLLALMFNLREEVENEEDAD